MLTETNRGNLIKNIKNNVDFSYGLYKPSMNIIRYYEGHDWENPQILIDFLPANRNKFMSVSNLTSKASPNSEFHNYGYCQIEQVVIRCYAGKHQDSRAINGRLIAEHYASKCLDWILRNWNGVLASMNASLEEYEPFSLKDASIFDRSKGTFVYIYELTFYLRTLFSWNDKPSGEEGEEVIAEDIEVLTINNDYSGKIDT